MRKLFLAICLSAVFMNLSGCGGASAQTVPTVSAPATGGAADGYDGGTKILRDVSGASGGTRGKVNTAFFVHLISGEWELAFEWASLCLLDNNSRAGENVCSYNQANKRSTGPTWAGVDEVTDVLGLAGAMVGREIDVFVTGVDNGLRIGLDIVVGDSWIVRALGKSSAAQATTGIHIGATTNSPDASWKDGIVIDSKALRGSALTIIGPDGHTPVLQIMPNGDIYKNGQKVL